MRTTVASPTFLSSPSNPHTPDWSRALGRPSARAIVRSSVDDFVVEEDLGFEPSGDGEHLFLFVEKHNRTTDEVAARLARIAGVPRRAVRFSGLKDKRARTRQWFSVQCVPRREVDWPAAIDENIVIVERSLNRRKLRRGAHRANRFTLVLREVHDPEDTLQRRLESLARSGAPNYFGEQRFGRGGGNVGIAERVFAGSRVSRRERSIALSAARSLIFNDVLARRIEDGSWTALQVGDVANLNGRDSVFAVAEVDAELETRCQQLDVHPTGPLWGKGAPGSSGDIETLERSVAAQHLNLVTGLEANTDVMRRPLRVRLDALEWHADADRLTLTFSLRRGSFATAVLRELITPIAEPGRS